MRRRHKPNGVADITRNTNAAAEALGKHVAQVLPLLPQLALTEKGRAGIRKEHARLTEYAEAAQRLASVAAVAREAYGKHAAAEVEA